MSVAIIELLLKVRDTAERCKSLGRIPEACGVFAPALAGGAGGSSSSEPILRGTRRAENVFFMLGNVRMSEFVLFGCESLSHLDSGAERDSDE